MRGEKQQFIRWNNIDRQLREKRYPNCKSLAMSIEGVSPKTIQRDIDYLKNFHDAPIEYDRQRHGFYYSKPNYRLPVLNMTESDLFALCIARHVLEQYKGTPLHPRLSSIYDRITTYLPDNVSINPSLIGNRILFFSYPATTIASNVWQIIAQAITDNSRICFCHKSYNAEHSTDRLVDPYYLISFRGEWYLSGHCYKQNQIRTFGVSRISEAKILPQKFTTPKNFNRSGIIVDQMGIIYNPQQHDIQIKFNKSVADHIYARQWHPHQSIKKNKDGSILLSFPTHHTHEVKDWVLSWGSKAKLLKPKVLVQEIASDIKDMASAYRVTNTAQL